MKKKKDNSLEKHYVPYPIALQFREVGFNDKCFGLWMTYENKNPKVHNDRKLNSECVREDSCSAITWHQAVDWLIEIHKLNVRFDFIESDKCAFVVENLDKIDPNFSIPEFLYASPIAKNEDFMSYRTAREEAIITAIKIIKERRNVKTISLPE